MAAFLPFAFDIQFLTDSGAIAASHYVYTYESGTTTPKATYTDSTGNTANANPIPLNSAGRCALFLGSGSYSFELRATVGGTLIKRWDDVSAGATGAPTLSFTQAGSGAITRTVQTKLQEVVSVADWGATGDGSDESGKFASAASQAVAAGATLLMDGTKTYSLGSAITLPSNLRLQTNGATFRDLNGTTSNTALITVSSGCKVDKLNVSIPVSIRRDRAILVDETCDIGEISLVSVDQQLTDTDLNDGGLQIVSASDVRIGKVYIENYDRAVRIATCERVEIGRLDLESYVRGCWIIDSSYVNINGGHIRTASPNASLTAGNNGYLIGCDTADSTHNITLADVVVEDAGEHAIRLGGPETIRNVFFVRPQILAPGACGIKIRGSDGATSIYNYNVVIDSPIIEDCGTSVGASTNRCGILAEWTAGLQIIAPTIRQRDLANCASFGIRVNACNDALITNPTIHTPQYDCILIHADEADISRFNLVGGSLYNAGRNALSLFITAAMTARNVHTSGVLLQSATNYGLSVSNSGSLSDINFDIRSHSNTAGAVSNAETGVVLNVKGLAGSNPKSSVAAADGSTWQEGTTSGNSYVYKGGAWRAQGVLSGSATWNPSNLANGDGETTTVTVTGAALGNYAQASFSLDLQGMTMTSWVSAADTVSVRLQNETGGAIDLASGTLRAIVTPN